MIAAFQAKRFLRELAGWSLRGVLCAVSSFWWALLAGFNGPAEITGMIVGIAFWAAVFAVYSSWRGHERMVAALKIGAWIKIILSAAGWSMFALCSLVGSDSMIIDAGILGILPDSLMGVVAVRIVTAIAGSSSPEALDSVGWTSLITIVNGALFAFVIGALALAGLLWWWLWPVLLRKLKLSPARLAG